MEHNPLAKPISVVFFGSDTFALPTLRALLGSSRYTIVAVFTQPAKPTGRKQILLPNPVKVMAEEYNLAVYEDLTTIKEYKDQANVGVLVHYGKILKTAVLEMFPKGIINIHPSLLPAWRGPSPLQAAILHNDHFTGVSVMVLDAGMDTGPILVQKSIPLQKTAVAHELYNELFVLGSDLLLEVLPLYINGQCIPQPQANVGVSYSKIITRQDGKIFPTDTPQIIYNKWRAYHPWPGIFCEWQGKRIKLLQVKLQNNALVIMQLQIAGKQPMSYNEFMRGYPDFLLSDIS